MKRSTVKWAGKMRFEAETDTGHRIVMDASEAVGGENLGPRPTDAVLAGLAGCTSIDVVSILGKMRLPLEGLEVGVEAEARDTYPKSFHTITLNYSFTGDLPAAKVERAIQLSRDTYCSVAHLLSGRAKLIYRYRINGGEFKEVPAVAVKD